MAARKAKPVIAYKGFDKDLKCRDYQFAIGKTFKHEGKVEKCKSGFHACENPLDVFEYYDPGDSRFCIVELSGELSREVNGDSKIAAGQIKLTAELKIPELVTEAIEFVTALCKPADSRHATGYQSASSATGDQSASSATGYRSASSATGDRSASSATGEQSASSATGDRSASSATGYRSASSATGYQSASSVSGKGAVAMSIGYGSKSMADKGGAIVCVYRDENWNLIHIRASKVGDNGVKPNVFYTLNSNGDFVEAQP
jgi:hypothetical protein